MIRRLICYVQFCVVLLGVSPNLLQPEYSIKILNTENIVLSLGNTDVHDESDLEMIENASENVEVDNKLINFHKYVESVIITERPPEKLNTSLPLIHFLAEAENNKCKNKTERVKKKKSKWLKKLKNRQKFWRNNWVVGKRELTTPENEEEEVTADFEKEYHDFVEEARKNNSIYKYTDEGKPEENMKEIMKKIVDFKPPKNCTNITGVGIQAMECLLQNAASKKISQKQVVKSASSMFLVWLGVYLAVVVPLWCMKGWCCCCFRCSFCFPHKTVKEIQKYIVKNPPGVYLNSKGEEEHYDPNPKETELYEKLKKSILEF